MKWEWLVPLVEYTESWRQTRKLLDRSLRPGSMVAYRPLQLSKARILLAQLPTNPDEWEAHPEQFVIFYRRRYIYLSILQIVQPARRAYLGHGYGYEVKRQNDLRVNVSRKLSQLASEITGLRACQ